MAGRRRLEATRGRRRGSGSPQPPRRSAPLIVKLAAAVVAPLLVLGGVEAALRLAGSGYPPGFLVALDGDSWTTNLRFGWRFFPRELARSPVVQRIPREPAAGTVRVLVLGGSAAMGTPDSAYGLARHLEARLAAAAPAGVRFELVNGAMTAINSHVVREIVADCARLEPDVVVVYLGNNEVVGPFGPGTVFHGVTRAPAVVRLSLRVKSLRLGQLIDAGVSRLASDGPPTWRGMEMFVGHRVTADDPRLGTVERALDRNLEAILRSARRAGAEVVLSTVAVNLTDCPPFASVHSEGLGGPERERFRGAFDRGESLLETGRPAEALAALEEAASVDDRFAAVHFRLGQALTALGRRDAAHGHLVRARDLDALRFRADGRVNRVIRQVGKRWRGRGVELVDAAAELVGPAAAERPGRLFYEHVHLTFEGTARLAEVLSPAVLSAAGVDPGRAAGDAPELAEVAERLGFSACERYRLLREIHGMMLRPPFTDQLDHESRSRTRASELAALWSQVAGREAECAAWQRLAVARNPDDLELRRKLAALLARAGEAAEAAREWEQLVAAVPGVPEWRTELGFALLESGRELEGVSLFREIARTAADGAGAWANLGYVLRGQGDLDGAEAAYRRALDRQRRRGEAWAGLAEVELARGRRAAAKQLYLEAIARDPGFAEAQVALGYLEEGDGAVAEAEARYRAAVEVAPHLASGWNNLGFLLQEQGRDEEAERCLRRALTADPAFDLAAFNLGDLLLGSGRPAEAVEAYRLGLLAAPGNVQARVNLAESLLLSGRGAEAVAELERARGQAVDSGREDLADRIAGRLAGLSADAGSGRR